MENSAHYHASEAEIRMMSKKMGISKRANEIIDEEIITPQRTTITNNQLRTSSMMTHHSTCNQKIIVRK